MAPPDRHDKMIWTALGFIAALALINIFGEWF